MIAMLSAVSAIELIVLTHMWARRGASPFVASIFVIAFLFAVISPLLYAYNVFTPDYIEYFVSGSGIERYCLSSMIFFFSALLFTAVLPPLRPMREDGAAPAIERSKSFSHLMTEPVLAQNALYLVWLISVAAAYISGVIRFSSAGYVFQQVNAFQVMMSTAKGGWYLTVLSTVFILPAILTLGSIARDRRKLLFVLFFVTNVILLLSVSKLPTRTPILSFMFAALLLSRPLWSRAAFYTFSIGSVPVGVFLLIALNAVRQGITSTFETSAVLNSLGMNFTPAVNGAYLMERGVDYQYFKNTIASMTPLPLVPRVLFPYKAYDDIQAVLTRDLFPDLDLKFFARGSTLTYTVVGAAYANLGYVGVFVGGALWCLAIWYIAALSKGEGAFRALAIYLALVVAVGFRTSLETIFVNLQFFTYMFILIAIFTRRNIVRPERA